MTIPWPLREDPEALEAIDRVMDAIEEASKRAANVPFERGQVEMLVDYYDFTAYTTMVSRLRRVIDDLREYAWGHRKLSETCPQSHGHAARANEIERLIAPLEGMVMLNDRVEPTGLPRCE